MLRAKFAFYYHGAPGSFFPPCAAYAVEVSDNPTYPVGRRMIASEIIEAGGDVPKTPSYNEWIAAGTKA